MEAECGDESKDIACDTHANGLRGLLPSRVEAPEPLRQEGECRQGDGAINYLAQRVPTGQDAKCDKQGGYGTKPQHRTGYEAMTAAAA